MTAHDASRAPTTTEDEHSDETKKMQPQADTPSITRVLTGWLVGAQRSAVDVIGNETAQRRDETLPEEEAAPASMLDRLWAAAAHVGPFFGFWLVAPLVVYLIKRNGSAFARWHSYQALVLTLWSLFSYVLTGVFAGFGLLIAAILDKLGLERAAPIVFVVGALPIAFVAVFSVLMSAIGGLKALRGKPWTMPIIGRIARGRARRST
jgi:uncharacterized Tic20 family protein